MTPLPASLPCPPMTLRLELPPDDESYGEKLATMPACPGVLAIADEAGSTIAMRTATNLRRAAETQLADQSIKPATRRIALGEIAHTVECCTAGSSFEADWAYLQHARQRMPATYRAALDRWQAWFVHCDADARFPNWSKTAHPNVETHTGTFLGPLADKHAAGRMMELLQDAFDLCRYHHILVQAPSATACAYKEMGRCPAPCDGSVSLEAYRDQTRTAISFACDIERGVHEYEQAMEDASRALDFENAQRHRTLLERTKPLQRAEFKYVNRIQEFQYLAIMPSERRGNDPWVRLFLIAGGWIQPLLDFSAHASPESLNDIEAMAVDALRQHPADLSEHARENTGLVCWHLFQPRAKAPGAFLPLKKLPDASAFQQAVRKACRKSSTTESAEGTPGE